MIKVFEKYKLIIGIGSAVVMLFGAGWGAQAGIESLMNSYVDSRIEKKLDIEVWEKKMYDDSVKTAREEYKDSILQAQARYRDSLELVYKHKYTGLIEANISPAEKKETK